MNDKLKPLKIEYGADGSPVSYCRGQTVVKGKITPNERSLRGRSIPINELLAAVYKIYETLLDQSEEQKIEFALTFNFLMTVELPDNSALFRSLPNIEV